MSATVSTSNIHSVVSADELAERGYRRICMTLPDGSESCEYLPLTSEEFLHPAEGYIMPNNTFHADVVSDARDMLARRYADDPHALVFHDVLIWWDERGTRPHCPDVCVVFGVRTKAEFRTRFVVPAEGVRPALIIEVVSPAYRKEDREVKVEEYEQEGVQEYVILDRRPQRGRVTYEVLGYRLARGRYRPIAPDDDGRILCQTVGLWISTSEGCIVLEDANSGERLLTSRELDARARELDRQARELVDENAQLRARLEALEAELAQRGNA